MNKNKKWHFSLINDTDTMSGANFNIYAVDMDEIFFSLRELERMHRDLGDFIDEQKNEQNRKSQK